MTTRPATLLSRSAETTWRGAVASTLTFEVPLVHREPDERTVRLFARAVRADDAEAAARPWLVFFQGGPGFEALRPAGGASGWLGELLPHFQVLLLDQRGTGGSTPLDASALLAQGAPEAQLAYVSHFRATDIVADAEAVRLALGIESWSTLGQSYGGFITLSYLSVAPESLDRCLITGGLGEMRGDAAEVYRATYQRMSEREQEFLAWHPEDEARLAKVYDVVRSRRALGSPEVLPDGSDVTETTVQRLGMFLGGNTRVQALHFALETAVVQAPDGPRLSAAFLGTLQAQLDHAGHPLYWLLQESIYSSGQATKWAADRVRRESYPDYLPTAPRPKLLGEMALPSDYSESVPLTPLQPLAALLAQNERWGALYDAKALAANVVPVAAAVYTHDVYVDRELSLATAATVNGLQVWENSELHHDGIADEPALVIGALLRLTGVGEEASSAPAAS